MPHHLGNTFYRNTCLQSQRAERIPADMVAQRSMNATSQVHSFVLSFFKRIEVYRSLTDGSVHQSTQPAQMPVSRCRGIALFLQIETIITKKTIVRVVREISSSLRLLTKELSCLSELLYLPSLLLSCWALSSSALRARSAVGFLPMPCKWFFRSSALTAPYL